MKTRISHCILFTLFAISIVSITSCKSSFPAAGTVVDCNGKQVVPVLNPTQRAYFPGGSQAMFNFFRENINLPNDALKGKVRIAFIVTREGEICDVRVTSYTKNPLKDEVIRVVETMPRWIPGNNHGTIIDCYYLLDIKF